MHLIKFRLRADNCLPFNFIELWKYFNKTSVTYNIGFSLEIKHNSLMLSKHENLNYFLK